MYDGYVAAAHAYHPHETEYICLEKEFEGLDPKIFTLAKTTSQNAQRLVLAEVDSAFYGLKFPTNMGAQCVMCLKK